MAANDLFAYLDDCESETMVVDSSSFEVVPNLALRFADSILKHKSERVDHLIYALALHMFTSQLCNVKFHQTSETKMCYCSCWHPKSPL